MRITKQFKMKIWSKMYKTSNRSRSLDDRQSMVPTTPKACVQFPRNVHSDKTSKHLPNGNT